MHAHNTTTPSSFSSPTDGAGHGAAHGGARVARGVDVAVAQHRGAPAPHGRRGVRLGQDVAAQVQFESKS
jgi:hypothetical protein